MEPNYEVFYYTYDSPEEWIAIYQCEEQNIAKEYYEGNEFKT